MEINIKEVKQREMDRAQLDIRNAQDELTQCQNRLATWSSISDAGVMAFENRRQTEISDTADTAKWKADNTDKLLSNAKKASKITLVLFIYMLICTLLSPFVLEIPEAIKISAVAAIGWIISFVIYFK